MSIHVTGKIADLVEALRNRTENNFDNIICYDNDEGTGKSTANIRVGQEFDPTFKICTSRIFNYPNAEIITKAVTELPKGIYLDVDEAGNVFYKQDWNSRDSRELNKLFMRSRKMGKTIGMCIPRFVDLNEFFRNHRVWYRVHIPYRGIACVQVKDTKKDVVDRWHLKVNRELMNGKMGDKYKQDMDANEYMSILREQKGYCFDFRFSELSEGEQVAYEEVVKANEARLMQEDNSILEERSTQPNLFNPTDYVEQVIKNGWLSIPKIAANLQISQYKAKLVRALI